MPNVRLIDADELRNAPELPLGLPPADHLTGPLPRNLPLPVPEADIEALVACETVLEGLDPQHAARVVRALVARFHLVDLW